MVSTEGVAVRSRTAIVFLVFAAVVAVWLLRPGSSPLVQQSSEISAFPVSTPETGESDTQADAEPDGGGSDPILSVDEAARAIDLSDENFFAALRLNPHCADCDQIFAAVKQQFAALAVGADPVKVKLLASALAQSERAEMVQEIISRYRAASGDPAIQTMLAESLELVSGDEEVSRELAPLVRPEEGEELKEAAVTGLSGMNDTVAAEALLQFARSVGDGKGGYDTAVGLGEFIPNAEAVPFLQRVAADGSAEAPLAIRALFNGGAESTKSAIEAILAVPESEQQRLLSGAQSHVLMEPLTLDYLKSLAAGGQRLSAPLRAFIAEILAKDVRE